MDYIEFGNNKTYRSFKRAYLGASLGGRKVYTWEGAEILTAWAKYALQYAEMVRCKAGLKILFPSKDGRRMVLRAPTKTERAKLEAQEGA